MKKVSITKPLLETSPKAKILIKSTSKEPTNVGSAVSKVENIETAKATSGRSKTFDTTSDDVTITTIDVSISNDDVKTTTNDVSITTYEVSIINDDVKTTTDDVSITTDDVSAYTFDDVIITASIYDEIIKTTAANRNDAVTSDTSTFKDVIITKTNDKNLSSTNNDMVAYTYKDMTTFSSGVKKGTKSDKNVNISIKRYYTLQPQTSHQSFTTSKIATTIRTTKNE